MPNHLAARHRRTTLLSRVISGLLSAALVGGLVAFLGLAVGPRVFGYRTATMLTGSMTGTIDPGDVIVSVPIPTAQLAVGDVITFHAPVPDQHVETHRVVAVRHTADGRTIMRTQGDANPAPDPWRATVRDDTVWRTVHVVPMVGNVVRALRTPVVGHGLWWGALGALVLLGTSIIWTAPDEENDMTGALPLDEGALRKLAEDIEDEAFAASFAWRYQQLLPQRMDRISDALAAADLGSALEATLSLKVSSGTVGARELVELASEIESDVRRADVSAALSHDLGSAVRRADEALTSYLALAA
ncbi:signal peptidase I [Nocardioides sp. CN2-186]|uniref:signal peptidase I n=1 Tax=Nocardioides tweenelious TaxID=3156607 RepID=UPI0032B3A58C